MQKVRKIHYAAAGISRYRLVNVTSNLGLIVTPSCNNIYVPILLQVDWPWIAEWAYAGIFDVAVNFQNQDQFWVSRQKNQVSFLFLFFRNVEK